MTCEAYETSTPSADEAGEPPARHSKIRAGARVVLGLALAGFRNDGVSARPQRLFRRDLPRQHFPAAQA